MALFRKKVPVSDPDILVEDPMAETVPVAFVSDENVPIERLDIDHVVNRSDPGIRRFDARRSELHVATIPYEHVDVDASGAWIYRKERF